MELEKTEHNTNSFLGRTLETTMFENWLEETTSLSDASIKLYVTIVNTFLKNKNNISSSDSINYYLINVTHKKNKRGYAYYYALKKYAIFKLGAEHKKIFNGLIKPVLKDRKKDSINLELNIRKKLIKELFSINKESGIIAAIMTYTGARVGDVLKLEKKNIIAEPFENTYMLRLTMRSKGDRYNTAYIKNYDTIMMIVNYFNLTFDNKNTDRDCLLYVLKEKKDYCFLKESFRRTASKKEINLIIRAYETFRLNLKMAATNIGLNSKLISKHDFRRSYSKDIYEIHNDIVILKNVLNHKRIDTTLRYLKQSGLETKKIFTNYEDDLKLKQQSISLSTI